MESIGQEIWFVAAPTLRTRAQYCTADSCDIRGSRRWGLLLIGCDNPLGLLTIVGPILYTYLVVNVTGQATLDKNLARERPGPKEYMESTNGMILMPTGKNRPNP